MTDVLAGVGISAADMNEADMAAAMQLLADVVSGRWSCDHDWSVLGPCQNCGRWDLA